MDSVVRISTADVGVLVFFAYLLPYLALTLTAFLGSTPEQVRSWAHREARGTFMQRYVIGTAPGPGASLFIAAAALVVAVLWLPGHLSTTFSALPRTLVALALVIVAWVCVVVAFAVTFQADNLVENEQALDFPGEDSPAWADYVYFALAAMTTFGTTDVNVTSRDMRRTVAANTVIAFVFNTVTVASLVSALGHR
ncbi:membrane protein [Streptomyces rimosus subsp. rimosus]|nr:membrane protein [Streptomyces sp. NRRL WC-3701]KOT57874.1 membrane protein [Streptomyces rimosus subsp. rimosus]KOT62323.1 membrane protein [Streptomyces rimosus subsp. rimosus]KOT77362.1 membrane protein [Streptomyces rimosus subsp. rimosus]KOT80627.1 membrane protein [Streptomyces rimosus subsp. rimosus]